MYIWINPPVFLRFLLFTNRVLKKGTVHTVFLYMGIHLCDEPWMSGL